MYKNIIGAALVVAVIFPSSAFAQTPVTQTASAASSNQTFLDFQVEQPAKMKSAVAPVYPSRLRAAGIEGQVLAQFIVDENGRAIMESFKVLKTADNAFSEAVKKAVSETSYTPAELDGRKVRQIVQQSYKFSR